LEILSRPCDRIESDHLGLSERGMTVGAIAIDPLYQMVLLARGFDQIPQEGLFIVG